MTSAPEILAVAQSAARAASEVLLKYFGRVEFRHKQASHNLVTTADLESEQLISQMIEAQFPSHAILREESASTGGLDAEHLWIVDPLDATNNYAHGIPHFCISIGYAHRGQRQVGVVYDPLRNEMFSAVRGGGAKLNDQPIRVTNPSDLTECIVATGFYYERGEVMERTLDGLRDLFRQNIRGMRRMGAAGLDLSWVACGRMQAFFEYRLAPWDYAAGSLIVEEAGGICRDRAGHPLTLGSCSILAAGPAVFPAFKEVVAWE